MECEKMPPGGQRTIGRHVVILLCAACTGCIKLCVCNAVVDVALPRRCLHGVHQEMTSGIDWEAFSTLPRRCLHGVHPTHITADERTACFASALPARGASGSCRPFLPAHRLCLGAACTGCIRPLRIAAKSRSHFASALPARGASRREEPKMEHSLFASALPARGASCDLES